MIRTDNIFPNLMNRKTYNNVKIFMIALALCLIAVPVSRYLSPRAIVNGHDVYLAWLPLSGNFDIWAPGNSSHCVRFYCH